MRCRVRFTAPQEGTKSNTHAMSGRESEARLKRWCLPGSREWPGSHGLHRILPAAPFRCEAFSCGCFWPCSLPGPPLTAMAAGTPLWATAPCSRQASRRPAPKAMKQRRPFRRRTRALTDGSVGPAVVGPPGARCLPSSQHYPARAGSAGPQRGGTCAYPKDLGSIDKSKLAECPGVLRVRPDLHRVCRRVP